MRKHLYPKLSFMLQCVVRDGKTVRVGPAHIVDFKPSHNRMGLVIG